MAIYINVSYNQQNKRICVPYKSTHTVLTVVQEVIKRSSGLNLPDSLDPSACILSHKGSELFHGDTLEDLSIADGTDDLNLTIPSPSPSSNQAPSNNNNNTTPVPNPTTPSNTLSEDDSISNLLSNITKPITLHDMLIKQIDVVVLDVSGSMKSLAFVGDSNQIMTRIEAAQAFFQAYIDKFHSYEFPAAVGLVCFGERVESTFPISRAYDSFSSELGNVEANQSRTRLYEAIALGAQMINDFKSRPENSSILADASQLQCRILCLTDGADNSGTDPYVVYQFLKKSNIVLDSLPIGKEGADTRNRLCALTTATGGSCFEVQSLIDGVQLFEREAVLSLAVRSNFKPFATQVDNKQQFDKLAGNVFVAQVETQAPVAVMSKAVSSSQATTLMNNIGSGTATTKSSLGGGAIKRIVAEWKDMTNDPSYGQFNVFLNEDDVGFWKIVMRGRDGSPYEGGYFLLSVQFPGDYPFKPPKVRFVTKIYHCNINNDGGLCLDILKDCWSPALTIGKVMMSIDSLLGCPNPDDPLDSVKAGVYRDNRVEYNRNAALWTANYAGKCVDELKTTYNLM